MNMKKTMAAIAAGAVAVSAMATSVSALADKTLKYNLVETLSTIDDGEVVLTARFTNLDLSKAEAGAKKLQLALISPNTGEIKSVSITGRNTVDNSALTPINLSTDNASENFSNKVNKTTGIVELDLGLGRDLPCGQINEEDVTVTLVVSYTVKHKQVKIDPINGTASITASFTEAADEDGAAGTAVTIKQEAPASGFKARGESTKAFPFKTALDVKTNIIYYLETAAVNPNNAGARTSTFNDGIGSFSESTYGSYVNVGAVLNDAVANYEGVVFKFNAATRPVVNENVKNTSYNWYQVDRYAEDWFVNQLKADGLTNCYDDYSKFGEHLYNGTSYAFSTSYGTELTGYTGYDWAGYNLFQGALIVNENLTMSLSDTEFFDWQESSISFDWDSIYSNVMTSNNFATYIQSLRLTTSSKWYWDSMDVELTAGAAEDASSGAGTAGDEDTLDGDDDSDGDIALDDDDDDGDVAADTDDDDDDDDTDVDTTVDTTQAPAQTASNPQTGNASVALAVIPVALAAAAIVAKKRG